MIDFGLDDLDDLQKSQEEGINVPIHKPGGQDVLFTVKVAGPDSKVQRRANERGQEEFTARGAATPLTRDEQKVVNDRYLSRCCLDWSGVKTRDGQEINFSEEAAFELIQQYPLVREAIDQAAANRLRFIRRSQTA